MDELLVTMTRDVNLYYGDQSRFPPWVHLARSIGGPAANLAAAGLLFALAPGSPDALLSQLAEMNLYFGLITLLPLPSVDGEEIWRRVPQVVAR
jgi:Zn-dependent protease